MSNDITPLKFKTIFKEKIWGGNKMKTVLGKDFSPLNNCGETWEISGLEGNLSVVSEGDYKNVDIISLIDQFRGDLVGNKIYDQFGNKFPLLIKFIDANDDLSIQVHPDDKMAMRKHQSSGKTEMWYVLDADKDASLVLGFNQEMDREKYLEHYDKGTLESTLNREPVKSGDVFVVSAGQIHTIGKGMLIAEIQQASDITYRIYDFDRVDDQGNRRELHLDEALEAIDSVKYDNFKRSYQQQDNQRMLLESCQYFETNKLSLTQNYSVSLHEVDSFKIYICLEGEAMIITNHGNTSINKGEVVLIPAATQEFDIKVENSVQLLETYIP